MAGLAVLAVCLLLLDLTGSLARERAISDVSARMTSQSRLRASELSREISQLRRDVVFLARAPAVQGIVGSRMDRDFDVRDPAPDAQWRRQLQEVFGAFAEAHPDLLQVRLIGVAAGGLEIVRVDRVGDRIVVVPPDQLQAKGDRDYFLATLDLRAGDTFVSDLDLNREHGKVQEPHLPTLRATTPVHAADGRLFGLVVVNMDGRALLDTVAANLPKDLELYLTNGSGDFLIHPNAGLTFGFDLGQRHRWSDEFARDGQVTTSSATVEVFRSAAGRIYLAASEIHLDERDPTRILRVSVTAPGAAIERAVGNAREAALAGMAIGLIIVGVFIYLYLLLLRQRQQVSAEQGRLAALVSSADDAIIGHTHDGIITDWNPAAERLFGYSVSEAAGRHLSELIVPAERQDEEKGVLQRIARGESVPHFETRRRHRDGHLIDVSVRVAPVFGADGTVAAASVIVRDITTPRRAEEALRAAQQRLVHSARANGIGLWEWNLETGELAWDETMFMLYGCSREEFPCTPDAWRKCLHPDDIERVEKESRAAIAGNGILDTGFRVVTKSGEIRHIGARAIVERDAAGRPLRMLGTNFDVTRTKEQEERIREGEARWRQLANSMPQLVWTCRGDGPCDFLSEQWIRYTGIPEAEQLGSAWLEQVHPDDRPLLAQRWQAAVDTRGVFNVEFRIRRHDGVYRWFDTRAVPLLDPASGAVVRWFGSNTDIEDRKKAEEALNTLNATLEQQVLGRTEELREVLALQGAILSNAGFAIIATGLEGTITLFNPAAERMLGYQAEELLGKSTPAIFHDPAEVAGRVAALSAELRTPVEPGFEALIAKAREGIPDANEWAYVRKDGTRFPVWLTVSGLIDDDGRIFGYLVMGVDLTQRRLQEQALRDSERFLKNLTDNIPGMVGYWDAGLRCRFANDAYRVWFGKTSEQMLGVSMQDLLGPDLFRRNEPYIRASLRGEAQSFERILTKADGSTGYTWAQYVPDFDGQRVRGFFVLVSDVTELKQAQIMLESVNRDLEVRTREAEAASVAKGQFLANMSHEIRSPMNAILGMLQLLLDTGLAARQKDYATKALSATQSLLHLLNDILDFSKIEAGKIALESHPFSLDAMLADISGIVASTVGAKPLELLFSIDAALPPSVIGDAFRLRQVLLNLIGNAIKFTQRGEVVVSISPVVVDERHVEIDFSVRDTGIGIVADKLSYIFEGFSQAEASTTRRFGGTGLGLAISRRLVELMGGSLGVESEPGVGSRFHFRLRFEIGGAAAGEPESASRTRPVPDRPMRVLIVDDNPVAREALRGLVTSLGWRGECAASGEQAMTLMSGPTATLPYDLILVDWQMPGLDGWETARRLRQLSPVESKTVILMLTVYEHAALTAAMQSEPEIARGVLVKPITPSMLFDAMIEQAPHKMTRAARERSRAGLRRLSGLRLLVVEDNAMNQQVARELLEKEGAIVDVADSGADGVERVLGTEPPFDAVLMDIQMPEMDGLEATRRIRQEDPAASLPIIAMTANAMASDRAACLAAGMNDHIAKPIDLDRVVATILSHCRPGTGSTPPVASRSGAGQSEIASALGRIGGNQELLEDLARRFDQDAERMLIDLDRRLRDRDEARAAALLHSLKGMAGTIGATAVARRCEELEQQLQSPHAAEWIAASVAGLKELVTEANRELADALPRLRTQPPDEAAAEPEPFERDAAAALLDELEALLEGSNMRAVSVFAQLERRFGGALGASITALGQAVRGLDFKAARDDLEKLRASLPA